MRDEVLNAGSSFFVCVFGDDVEASAKARGGTSTKEIVEPSHQLISRTGRMMRAPLGRTARPWLVIACPNGDII